MLASFPEFPSFWHVNAADSSGRHPPLTQFSPDGQAAFASPVVHGGTHRASTQTVPPRQLDVPEPSQGLRFRRHAPTVRSQLYPVGQGALALHGKSQIPSTQMSPWATHWVPSEHKVDAATHSPSTQYFAVPSQSAFALHGRDVVAASASASAASDASVASVTEESVEPSYQARLGPLAESYRTPRRRRRGRHRSTTRWTRRTRRPHRPRWTPGRTGACLRSSCTACRLHTPWSRSRGSRRHHALAALAREPETAVGRVRTLPGNAAIAPRARRAVVEHAPIGHGVARAPASACAAALSGIIRVDGTAAEDERKAHDRHSQSDSPHDLTRIPSELSATAPPHPWRDEAVATVATRLKQCTCLPEGPPLPGPGPGSWGLHQRPHCPWVFPAQTSLCRFSAPRSPRRAAFRA